MKKIDIIEKIASEREITKKAATEMVEFVLDAIVDALVETNKVDLHGFGKFAVVGKEACKSKNPKTGEDVDVPAKNVPKFKFSSRIKNLVK